ncbi:MAG: hypothetical protein IID44_26260 [Planctomycetes bacterium]|nr:hypothetical protein [Planctomycetota bacterium]
MTPKITDEMRDELAARPGQPVRVEDDRTHKAYYLVAEEHAPGSSITGFAKSCARVLTLPTKVIWSNGIQSGSKPRVVAG